ncbi:MAG: DegV family protein [Oscillospiraceae bacterium]
MIKPVVITTDSASDIPPEIAERLSIGIAPLHVFLDGKDYYDGQNINIFDIFDTYEQKKILPTTSAVAIAEYTEFFKKYTDKGASIVHINFSSGLSSCYQNACIAAAELRDEGAEIYVVDSLSLTICIGHLVLKAADLRDAGLSAQEISQEITKLIPKLDMTFVIDSMEFLKKGGRCSALTAFGANILGIKPCIDLVNGNMIVGKKYRGKLEAVHTQYIDDRLSANDFDMERVFISHTGLSDERIELVIRHLKKTAKFKEIIVGECGCVVASHGAKNAMALCLLHK